MEILNTFEKTVAKRTRYTVLLNIHFWCRWGTEKLDMLVVKMALVLAKRRQIKESVFAETFRICYGCEWILYYYTSRLDIEIAMTIRF